MNHKKIAYLFLSILSILSIFLPITTTHGYSLSDTGFMDDVASSWFWSQNPTSGQIIDRFVAPETSYTNHWAPYSGCIVTGSMFPPGYVVTPPEVVYINSGTDFWNTTITGNYIYILRPGVHNFLGTQKTITSGCVTILGMENATIAGGGIEATSGMVIIDNVTIEPNNAGSCILLWGNKVTANNIECHNSLSTNAGMYVFGAEIAFLNDIISYNNTGYGIWFRGVSNGWLDNSQSYNNNTIGIVFDSNSFMVAGNNLLSYNNSIGLGIGDINKTSINNSQFFNNTNEGIITYDTLSAPNTPYVYLNNISTYNNGSHGYRDQEFPSSELIDIFFNDFYSYNNGGYGLFQSGSLQITYRGNLSLSGNALGNITGYNIVTGGFFSPLGWTTGSLSLGALTMTCALATQPQVSPLSQFWNGIIPPRYFTNTSCSNISSRSPAMVTPIGCYLFGDDIPDQIQPVNAEGSTFDSGFAYDNTQPQGYVSGMCTYLPPCGTGSFEGSGCSICNSNIGLNNVGGGLCCAQGYLNVGGICTPTPPPTCSRSTTGMMTDSESLSFWATNPTTGEIIEKFFGTGSAYTEHWSGYSGCPITTGNVFYITSGDTLSGTTILDNSIYILEEGEHIIGGSASATKAMGNCVGIIGKGLVTITTTSQLLYPMIQITQAHQIIDNINFDGLSGHFSPNHNAITLSSATFPYDVLNTTINNISYHDFGTVGLRVGDDSNGSGVRNTIINNVQGYNNAEGIRISTSRNGFITNSQFYNNTAGAGNGISADSNGTIVNYFINNIQAYNNIIGFAVGGGASIGNSSINNSQFYNNSNRGISIDSAPSALPLYLNNILAYNNGGVSAGAGIRISGMTGYFNNVYSYNNYFGLQGGTIYYYGDLILSGNSVDAGTTLIQGIGPNPVGRATGNLQSGSLSMDCIIATQPQVNQFTQMLIYGIWYFTNSSCSNKSIRSPAMEVPISCYLFGTGIQKQIMPITFNNGIFGVSTQYNCNAYVGQYHNMCTLSLFELICPATGLQYTGSSVFVSGGNFWSNSTGVDVILDIGTSANVQFSGIDFLTIINDIAPLTTGVESTAGDGTKTGNAYFSTGGTGCSLTQPLFLDTTGPQPPSTGLDSSGNLLISLSPTTCAGGSGSLTVTRSGMTDSGVGFSGYQFELYSGISLITTGTTYDNFFSFGSLPDGNYTIYVRGFDHLLNYSQRFTGSQTITILCNLTSLTCTNGIAYSGNLVIMSGGNYRSNTGNIDVILNIGTSANVQFSGGAFSPVINGIASLIAPVSVTPGDGAKTGNAYFSTGGTGCSVTEILFLDTIGPNPQSSGLDNSGNLLISLSPTTCAGGSGSLTVTRSGMTDSGVGFSGYQFELYNGMSLITNGTTYDNFFSFGSLPDGNYTIYVRGFDHLLNYSQRFTGSQIINIDCTSVSCAINITGSQTLRSGGILYVDGTGVDVELYSDFDANRTITGSVIGSYFGVKPIGLFTVSPVELVYNSGTVTGHMYSGAENCLTGISYFVDNLPPNPVDSGSIQTYLGLNPVCGQFDISWGSTTDGGVGVSGYQFEILSGGVFVTGGSTPANVTNATIQALATGTYQIRVRTCDLFNNCTERITGSNSFSVDCTVLSCSLGFTGANLFFSGTIPYTNSVNIFSVLLSNIPANYTHTGDGFIGVRMGISPETTGTLITVGDGVKTGYALYTTGIQSCFASGIIIMDQTPPDPLSTGVDSSGNLLVSFTPNCPGGLTVTRSGMVDSGVGFSGYEYLLYNGMTLVASGITSNSGQTFSAMTDGTYTIFIRGFDKLNNASQRYTGSTTFALLCNPTSLSCTNGIAYSGNLVIISGGNYRSNTGNIDVILNIGQPANVQFSGISFSPIVNGIASLTTPVTVTPGDGAKTGTAYFSTGGTGCSITEILFLDTTGPEVPSTGLDSSGNLLISYNTVCPGGGLNVTRSGMTDSGVGLSGYEFALYSGATLITGGTTTTNSKTFSGLPNGNYTIFVRGFDHLNNFSQRYTGSQTMTVNCSPLQCSIGFTSSILGVNVGYYYGYNFYGYYTNNTGIQVIFNANPNPINYIVTGVNAILASLGLNRWTGTTYHQTGVIMTGNQAWLYGYFYNQSGQNCTFTGMIKVDVTPPTVGTGGSGLSVSLTGGGLCAPAVIRRSGSIDTGAGLSGYERRLLSGSTVISTGTASRTTTGMTIPSLANGTYTFELIAIDNVGNRNTGSVTFTVNCPSGPVCMNGIVESPEQCDDGNSNDGDTCKNICVPNTCQCGGTYPNCNSCGGGGGGGGGGGYTPPTVSYPPSPPTIPTVYPTFAYIYKKDCAYKDKQYANIIYTDTSFNPYKNEIDILTDLCVTRGRKGPATQRAFEPNEPISRAEFIKILTKLTLLNNGTWFRGEDSTYPGELPYFDVANNVWYANYVAKFRELGFADILKTRRKIGGQETFFMNPEAPMPKNLALILLQQSLSSLGKTSHLSLSQLMSVDGMLLRGQMSRLFVMLYELGDISNAGNTEKFISTLFTKLGNYPVDHQKKKLASILAVLLKVDANLLWNKFQLNKDIMVKAFANALGFNDNKLDSIRNVHTVAQIGEFDQIIIHNVGFEPEVIKEISRVLTNRNLTFYKSFKIGEKRGDIKLLQQILTIGGYYDGPIDRIYSQTVIDATYKMQQEFSLLSPETSSDRYGQLDKSTRDFLNKVLEQARTVK